MSSQCHIFLGVLRAFAVLWEPLQSLGAFEGQASLGSTAVLQVLVALIQILMNDLDVLEVSWVTEVSEEVPHLVVEVLGETKCLGVGLLGLLGKVGLLGSKGSLLGLLGKGSLLGLSEVERGDWVAWACAPRRNESEDVLQKEQTNRNTENV